MTLPTPIFAAFQEWLEEKNGASPEIRSISTVGGGDINQACRVQCDQGDFFLKYNDASAYPGMFEAEAKGLSLLAKAGEIPVPPALTTHSGEIYSFLITEFQQAAPRKGDFWEAFGGNLARLHRQTQEAFGLDHDNYIGSLPQFNSPQSSWGEFFVTQRLEPQCKMARDQGQLDSSILRAFERLYARAEDLFPEEPPALVHGDLWSGNFMVNKIGEAAIIDPAVYFGHREMDLGMSRLFGGFDPAFYRSYAEEYPLESGWEKRLEIANLYPLLVHVNLFGGSYLHQVAQVLRSF